MPTHKRDIRTDRRQTLLILAGMAAPLAGMAVMQLSGSPLPLFVGIPICLGCIGWVLLSRHFYRCPKCGARLRFRSPPQDGAAIKYLCRSCDVEWDTGWSTDSGGFPPDHGKLSKADAPIPKEVLVGIKEALFQNRKVDAIQQFRASTGATLSEAVYRIESLEDDLRHESPEKFKGARRPDAK